MTDETHKKCLGTYRGEEIGLITIVKKIILKAWNELWDAD